jgi:clan AA aspartic protease
VNDRLEAVLTLRLRNSIGAEVELDAVVDTGFTGSLTMPATVAASLGLAKRSGGSAVLADGARVRFETFGAEVEWGGWRGVVVSAIGGETLIGMELLAGSEFRVEVVEGGIVEIKPLP